MSGAAWVYEEFLNWWRMVDTGLVILDEDMPEELKP